MKPHKPGCSIDRRGCVPGCWNYDPQYDGPPEPNPRERIRAIAEAGTTTPLAEAVVYLLERDIEHARGGR